MANYGQIESTETKLMFLGFQQFLKGKGIPILKKLEKSASCLIMEIYSLLPSRRPEKQQQMQPK